MSTNVKTELSGWGRYPWAHCSVQRPESPDAIRLDRPCLARGLGRAYGDAALNSAGDVVITDRLNRLLRWEGDRLTVEAGISLGEILAIIVPRGYFLPVVPGTQFVSVGGSIAADIHGKNHHVDGTFANHVESMTLCLADGSRVEVSRRKKRDLFWATVGGMGLTGIIEQATLRLRPVETPLILASCETTTDLEDTVTRLLDESRTEEYRVAWVDALAHGRSFGRGAVLRGRHATAVQARNSHLGPPKLAVEVPFAPPISPLNRWTMGAYSAFTYHKYRLQPGEALQHFEPFFFPLDGFLNWNRLYGPRGFIQYQMTLPLELAPVQYILETLRDRGHPPFLVVLKDFGAANPSPLSFPQPGFTMAIDIRVADGLFELLDELDRWVADLDGRIYLAKDARLKPEMFRAMQPKLNAFLEIKQRVDPDQRFCSDLSRRLGIH